MSDGSSGGESSADGEISGDLSQPRSSLRGPLILAKLVVDALNKKKRGESADYSAIVEQLSAPQMKPVVMRRWLQALKLCVSQLTQDFDMFVNTTLKFHWFDKDPEVAELYIDYLTNLLSAQTHYLRNVLQVLLKTFWSPIPYPEGDVAYHNIHEALQAIFHIVPTAPSVLMPLLTKSYPFKGKSAQVQEVALRNMLHITSYCPTLRDGILQLVIHQMLNIDVEVPRVGEEDEEEEEGEEEGPQFHVELETSGVPECPAHHHLGAPPTVLSAVYSQSEVMRNEMAEKLDIMMTLVLQYLHSTCHHNGTFVLEAAVELLQLLLKIFEQVVLPTHACSHVQFLHFKFTSYHEDFHSYFLDFLWEKFQDVNTPAVIRQSAAAYMASYIARAKFVPLSTAKLCLKVMMQWIHQYIDFCSLEQMRPDVKQHGPFFYLCQAVFYIFIFRHKALLEMDGGVGFLRQLNFERVISSRLNPLRMCLPTVVEMFASLSSHHEIVFCYTILEQNKRVILSLGPPSSHHDTTTASPHTQTNPLDCFFPFDPYSLRRSSKFICPLYQEWEGGEDEGSEQDSRMEDNERDLSSSSFPSNSYDHPTTDLDSFIPSSPVFVSPQ